MKIFVAGPARALGRRLVPIWEKDDEGNPAEWPGGQRFANRPLTAQDCLAH
jgi:hypothetical protein